jgi:hypothetical protein
MQKTPGTGMTSLEMTPEIRQQIADRGHRNFLKPIQQKAGLSLGSSALQVPARLLG